MSSPDLSHAQFGPWTSAGASTIARFRSNAEVPFCLGCSGGLHDILRTCAVCGRTPQQKHTARIDAGLDDDVYIHFGEDENDDRLHWFVEADGALRTLFPVVCGYDTAYEAMRVVDTRLRAHGASLS